MILLNVQSLAKHFGPEPVLDGVSFEVRPGERIGLVGPNGCGKTTLLRIIAGQEEPDKGAVELHPSARIGLLEQHPEFEPGQTVWDVAMSGLAELISLNHEVERAAADLAASSEPAEHRRLAERFDRLQHELEHRGGYHLDQKVVRVLEGLGLLKECHQQPVAQLSGGQQNRLMLARLLLSESSVLLLDEPSNHLDLQATTWLEDFLIDLPPGRAVMVVSHDRYFLDRVTNRTLELFHGTVDSYAGNFSAYWRQKAERLEVQRRTYEKQREFIAKTEDFIRRNHYGQKHQQAEDRRKKLERVERIEPPREIVGPPMGFPPAGRTGDIVLRIEGLAKSYDLPQHVASLRDASASLGETRPRAVHLFAGLSFDILRGQRWGILGPNATGKSTLLRCVVDQVTPDAGRVSIGQGVQIGYLDQLTAGVDPQSQVVDAIRPRGKEFTEPQRRDLLARFGLQGAIVFQRVESLSGGERSRTGLARLAAEDANVLILDEPTNHLDIWARDSLEQALRKFDGTVFLVSHDRYFLNRVVDHLLVVEPVAAEAGRAASASPDRVGQSNRFRVIEGNYDTYLHFVAQGLAASMDQPVSRASTNGAARRDQSEASRRDGDAKPARRKRRFPYRKAADIEAEIHRREAEIQECQFSLAQPEVFREGDRVRQVKARIAELEQSLPALYEHWEEAVELN
jgi:ATP-binding cassette subfamily F protein 3